MKPRLIIIRGNSGSGKSTIAREVRDRLGDNTMLIPQDVVRRDILHVKDRVGNPTIGLIPKMVLHGKEAGFDVVLEGIFSKKLYGEMLKELIGEYGENVFVFYMDISFNETLKRHQTKPNKNEYGAEKMKEWWLEKDYLDVPGEKTIPENYSIEEAVDYILNII